jgi:hypothetical protein
MNTQPANPFEYWQQTMSRWMPTACTPADKPTATAPEPFAFSPMMQNPFMTGMQMWQQSMSMWQSMMQSQMKPAAPATPKVTFDMGDPNAYMQVMQQWQQMWLNQMGSQMGGNR